MMYTVCLTAHEYGFVDIEASSIEEAKEKALELEANGLANWGIRDIEITDCTREDN